LEGSEIARVLLIDDEPQLLRLMGRVLERSGYEVTTAADGDAALAKLEAGLQLDVLIIDAGVSPEGARPVLSDATKRCPRVGVVLTSGRPLDESLEQELEAVRGVFLSKAFAPAALLRAVESVSQGNS
jgi:two-component system cell cycle sensor histidine kinase/response regulator CckA